MTYWVRAYQDSDWEQIRMFLYKNWGPDHPLCNKTLFDWQFRGFGNENQGIKFLLLMQHDEVIGIRGVIPGYYQVPVEDNHMVIRQGGSLAMWMVKKEHRNHKLGLMLHIEAQKHMPVITCAGSNPETSVPIYLKNGFALLDAMNRYVMPLDEWGYQQLLSQKVNVNEVKEWLAMQPTAQEPIEPIEPDVNELAVMWQETTFPISIFSLFRNAEFWHWRYLESAGFKYLFWGNARGPGIVVGRIEKISVPGNSELDGQKVLRIIELVPSDRVVWQGGISQDFLKLVCGIIEWAKRQGCLAADFYCSTSRFTPLLTEAGFRRQHPNLGPPVCSIAVLFQHLTYEARLINALYRIEIPGKGLIYPKFEDTYMVKSENDMDRPRLIDVG